MSKLFNQTKDGFDYIHAKYLDYLQRTSKGIPGHRFCFSGARDGFRSDDQFTAQCTTLYVTWKSRDLCLQKNVPGIFVNRDELCKDPGQMRIELESQVH